MFQMRRLWALLILFVILFSGCSNFSKSYRVGIDPTFFPAQLQGQASNVYGFSVDLLKAVSKIERISFKYLQSGTENLFSSLERNQYDAILSGISAEGYEITRYSCSKPYLLTGPVIVTTYNSDISKLSQLNNKLVGVISQSDGFFLVEKDPMIFPQVYNSVAMSFLALYMKQVDAIVIDRFVAGSYINNLYIKELKVVTDPLNDLGLRLITLKDHQPQLIERFNRGVQAAKRKGIYQNLLKKWQLH